MSSLLAAALTTLICAVPAPAQEGSGDSRAKWKRIAGKEGAPIRQEKEETLRPRVRRPLRVGMDDERPGSGRKGERKVEVVSSGRTDEAIDRLLEKLGKDLGPEFGPELRRLLEEARSSGRAKSSSDSKQSSHSRRVVVINGETVVDEEIVDGKPVRGGGARRAPARGRLPDLEDLVRDAMEKAKKGEAARASASDHHSESHRVVVVNGETVVDEKTVDGKPVRSPARRDGARRGGAALPKEFRDALERLRRMDGKDLDLKDFEKELEKLRSLERGHSSPERAGSSSGSSSRSTDRSTKPKDGPPKKSKGY